MLVSFQNIPKVSPCLIESHMTALKEMDGPYSPTIPLYRWEAKEVLWATCILSKAQSWARNQDDSLHLYPRRVFLLSLKGSVRTTTEGDLQPNSGFFMASPCNGMHRLDCAFQEHCKQTFLKFFCFAIFFFFLTLYSFVENSFSFLFYFCPYKYWKNIETSNNNIQRNHLAQFSFCCLLAFKFAFALIYQYSWTKKKKKNSAWKVCS